MAELLTVQEGGIENWQGEHRLVQDQDTGQHYVISQVQMPWQSKPETLVYPAEPDGTSSTMDFVAGGYGLDLDDAEADLASRLDDGLLLSTEQSDAVSQEMLRRDFEEFKAWVADGGDASKADPAIQFALIQEALGA